MSSISWALLTGLIAEYSSHRLAFWGLELPANVDSFFIDFFFSIHLFMKPWHSKVNWKIELLRWRLWIFNEKQPRPKEWLASKLLFFTICFFEKLKVSHQGSWGDNVNRLFAIWHDSFHLTEKLSLNWRRWRGLLRPDINPCCVSEKGVCSVGPCSLCLRAYRQNSVWQMHVPSGISDKLLPGIKKKVIMVLGPYP